MLCGKYIQIVICFEVSDWKLPYRSTYEQSAILVLWSPPAGYYEFFPDPEDLNILWHPLLLLGLYFRLSQSLVVYIVNAYHLLQCVLFSEPCLFIVLCSFIDVYLYCTLVNSDCLKCALQKRFMNLLRTQQNEPRYHLHPANTYAKRLHSSYTTKEFIV